MLRVLVTGMSGTGKSTALRELGQRGHRTADTDSDYWSHWVTDEEGRPDWVWRHERVTPLLSDHREGKLFVAGCKSNQKDFYPLFDHIALLSAPAAVILDRVATRTTNTYGKSAHERDEILGNLSEVEELLRSSATVEIDASAPLREVVEALDALA